MPHSDKTETLTTEMIESLRFEAKAAGDRRMAELCTRALQGHADGRSAVCAAINNARAQDSGSFVRVIESD